VSVVYPRVLLAFLAAVLGSPTPSAFRKLASELLPLAALVVCTLSDPASRVVFSAQISHHDTCPVLHVLCVVDDGEFLNEWENVEVVGLEIFFFQFLVWDGLAAGQVSLKHCQLGR